MARPTRGQKAAKTLGSEHMAKIGAEGGKKAAGTFKTKRGFAKTAGQRSGMARRLKMYDRKIAELNIKIEEAYRFTKDVPDDIKQLELTRNEYEIDRALLEAEYNGKHAVDVGGSAVEYEEQ